MLSMVISLHKEIDRVSDCIKLITKTFNIESDISNLEYPMTVLFFSSSMEIQILSSFLK